MQVFGAGTCIKWNCALKVLKRIEHYTPKSDNTRWRITVTINILVTVKFGVGDLRFMPLMKKSHVVYYKILPEVVEKGEGGIHPIYLAKDRNHRSYMIEIHGV